MAQRLGIQLTVEREADGGVAPNRYVPSVSAHIRLYWPPLASRREVLDALNEAYAKVYDELDSRYAP